MARIQNAVPLLGNSVLAVRFTAEWCPNCSPAKHAVTALESVYLLKHIEVDVADAHSAEAVTHYGIKRLPCVLLVDSCNATLARIETATPSTVREAVAAHCQLQPLQLDADV